MKQICRGAQSATAWIALSMLAALAVFLLSVGVDHVIMQLRLEHSHAVGVVRLLRDGATACFVLLLVLHLLNAQRRARERAAREVAVILELNDNVRNALQIIALSFAHPDEIERIRMVEAGDRAGAAGFGEFGTTFGPR